MYRVGQKEVDAIAKVLMSGELFRYHRGGCPHLQRSRLSLPLPEASALGYTPCGACSPPPPPVPAAPAPALYRVDLAGLVPELGPAAPADPRLKGEAYSRGPTR